MTMGPLKSRPISTQRSKSKNSYETSEAGRENTVRREDQGGGCDAALLLGPGNELDTFRAEGNTGFSLEEAEE